MFNKSGFNTLGFNRDASLFSSIPAITIKSYTTSKISDEIGMNKCVVVFTSDRYLSQWEARADGGGVGQGVLVGSGTDAMTNTDISFDIDYNELIQGDKTYRINIYGKNSIGEWSRYE